MNRAKIFLTILVFIPFYTSFCQTKIEARNLYELIDNVKKDMGWNTRYSRKIVKRMKICVPKEVCDRVYASDTIRALLYPALINDCVPFFFYCIYGDHDNFIYNCYHYADKVKKLETDSDSYFKYLMDKMNQINTLSDSASIDRIRFSNERYSYDRVTILTIVRLQNDEFQYNWKEFLQRRISDELLLISEGCSTE